MSEAKNGKLSGNEIVKWGVDIRLRNVKKRISEGNPGGSFSFLPAFYSLEMPFCSKSGCVRLRIWYDRKCKKLQKGGLL